MTEEQLKEIEARHADAEVRMVRLKEYTIPDARDAHNDRGALVEEVRRLREAVRSLQEQNRMKY